MFTLQNVPVTEIRRRLGQVESILQQFDAAQQEDPERLERLTRDPEALVREDGAEAAAELRFLAGAVQLYRTRDYCRQALEDVQASEGEPR